jgi:hypothetical protein
MNLTVQNYHSQESNWEYMSVHQFNNWMECPARTKAELAGQWTQGDKQPFLIGGYIDCALLTPTDIEAWWRSHIAAMIEIGLLSKAKETYGAKLSAMQQADAMIGRAMKLPAFMEKLEGDKQQIFTAELFGVKWRIMADSYDRKKNRLTDLKTSKSIKGLSWFDRDNIFDYLAGTNGKKRWLGDFIDEYNYWRQMSVYRTVISLSENTALPDAYIAAISKEKLPAQSPEADEASQIPVGIYHMADNRAMREELAFIETVMPQVIGWKLGYIDAPHCDRCAFCASVRPIEEREAVSVVYGRV